MIVHPTYQTAATTTSDFKLDLNNNKRNQTKKLNEVKNKTKNSSQTINLLIEYKCGNKKPKSGWATARNLFHCCQTISKRKRSKQHRRQQQQQQHSYIKTKTIFILHR